MEQTSVTLLARLRDGEDQIAWRDFLKAYGPPVFGFARRRGCRPDLAEDVVQEVLLEVFRQRETFRYDPAKGKFRSWLFVIVWQKVCAALRKDGPGRAAAPLDGDALADPRQPDPRAQFEEGFERGLLTALLDVVRRESPAAYQAFDLTALQGLSGDEAADVTGTSRNAVYLACRRVRARLRELGASYERDGALDEALRGRVEFFPADSVERRLTTTLGRSPAPAGP